MSAVAPLLAASTSVEVVGYVASALVVLSLTMTSVVRLRLISLAGSITFAAYGLLISSVPIIVTNAAIALINVWFLRTELGGRRDLGVSPVDVTTPFLVDFVQFHLEDIHRFQPGFVLPTGDDVVALLLTRDGLPAGTVIGRRRHGDHGDEVLIELDYVLRQFRDSRLGVWLYRGGAVFRAFGVDRVVSLPGTDAHRPYLERVGFRPDGELWVCTPTHR